MHAFRDQLPLAEAVHLGAQLPLLVRGIYYDGWSPGTGPGGRRKLEAFLAGVNAGLSGTWPTSAEQAGGRPGVGRLIRLLS